MQELIDRFMSEEFYASSGTKIENIRIIYPGPNDAPAITEISLKMHAGTEIEAYHTIERLRSMIRPLMPGYQTTILISAIATVPVLTWLWTIPIETLCRIEVLFYKTSDEIVERWYFRPDTSNVAAPMHRFLGPAEERTALSKNKKNRQQWCLYGKRVPSFQALLNNAKAFSLYLEKNPKKGLFVAKILMKAGILELSPEITENIALLGEA